MNTKKKKFNHKTWEQSKTEIEKTLNTGRYDAYDNELCLTYGIHYKHTLSHFPCHIFSAVYRQGAKKGLEYYVVNYVTGDTGESVIAQWKFSATDDSSKIVKKISIRQCLKILIFIPNQRAFIGYCGDMTLRGYTGVKFEEKSRLTVHSTILCMIYIEEFDELITAGQGYVFSWIVRMIAFGLLVDIKEPPLQSDVNSSREWVHRLLYDKHTKTIMALTDDTVYIISMVSRMQIDTMHNTHKASLTCCAIYHPYLYYITAARDGTIHIYHTGVQALIRTFSAHRDGVTGVLTLPQQPILISWSHTSGTLRMWRLDTLELTNETTLSENISFLQLATEDRLFYLSESEVRIYDINVLYSIFTTLTSPAESFKLCTVRRRKKKALPTRQDKKKVPGKTKGGIQSANARLENSRGTKLLTFINSSEGTENSPQTLNSANRSSSVISHETQNALYRGFDTEDDFDEDSTFLDQRLVCVLDNRSIMGVSPISGVVLNIIYPNPKSDRLPVYLDIDNTGNSYYVVLTDGKLIEFDCSVNPGQVTAVLSPEKDNLQRVCSVVAMELYVEEGSRMGMRRQGVFVGLENGSISLHDGGERAELRRDYERGGKRKSIRKRRSTINKIGPIITMSAMKILFHKLRSVYIVTCPTCLAVTSNVALCGFPKGTVEISKIIWKCYESTRGAKIKLECTSIALHSFTKIPIGTELQHKEMVTCANVSHLLSLFVTTAKDKTIKIWDSEGQLIRELLLGDSVPSACFLNGRDILASMRAHILRIEVHRYLPTEYLLNILEIDRAGRIKDVEPEESKPMEGPTESRYFFIKQNELISEADEMLLPEDDDILSQHEERKRINEMLRYMKKRKTLFTSAVQAMNEKKEKGEMFCGINLKDTLPVEKPQDNAADFVATLNSEAIAKYAVAPDGYIPNSVIRDSVHSVYPQPVFTFMKLKGRVKSKRRQTNSDETRHDLVSGRTTQYYMESEDDLFSVLSDESCSSSETPDSVYTKYVSAREMEVKNYLKGRRREGISMESPVKEKHANKRRKKKVKEQIVDDDEKIEKPRRKSSSKDKEVISKAPADKLVNLLEVLSRETWCPSIVTLDTFDEALSAIADVLADANKKTAVEICKFLCILWEACKGKDANKAYIRYFPVQLQSKIFESVESMLTSTMPSVQKCAIELLSKFDNVILKDVVMKAIMPKFLQRRRFTALQTFQEDEEAIATAARAIKFMSAEIDIGQVHTLSRMIGVNQHRGQKYDESVCVTGLSNALLKIGVDVIDVTIWSTFILPLLSKNPALVDTAKPTEPPATSTPSSQDSSSSIESRKSPIQESLHDIDAKIEIADKKRTVSFSDSLPQTKSSLLATKVSSLDHQDELAAGVVVDDEPCVERSTSGIKVQESSESSSSSLHVQGSGLEIELRKDDDSAEDEESVYFTASSTNTSRKSSLINKLSRSTVRLLDSMSSESQQRQESLRVLRNLRRSSLMVKSDQSLVKVSHKRSKDKKHKMRYSEGDLDSLKSEQSSSSPVKFFTPGRSTESEGTRKTISHSGTASATATVSSLNEVEQPVEVEAAISETFISASDTLHTAPVVDEDEQDSLHSSKSHETILSILLNSQGEKSSSHSLASTLQHSAASSEKLLSEHDKTSVGPVDSQLSFASTDQEKTSTASSADEMQASAEALLHLQSILQKKISATTVEQQDKLDGTPDSDHANLPKVEKIYPPRRDTVAKFILSEMGKHGLTESRFSEKKSFWTKLRERRKRSQTAVLVASLQSAGSLESQDKSKSSLSSAIDKLSSTEKRVSNDKSCTKLTDSHKQIQPEIFGILRKTSFPVKERSSRPSSAPDKTTTKKRFSDEKVIWNKSRDIQKRSQAEPQNERSKSSSPSSAFDKISSTEKNLSKCSSSSATRTKASSRSAQARNLSTDEVGSTAQSTKDTPCSRIISLELSKQELDEFFDSLQSIPSSSSSESIKQKLSAILSGCWLTEDGRIIRSKDLSFSDWRDIIKILQKLRQKHKNMPKEDYSTKKSPMLPPKPLPSQQLNDQLSFGNGDEKEKVDREMYSSFRIPMYSRKFREKRDINFAALKKQVVRYVGNYSDNSSGTISRSNTISKGKGDEEVIYKWKLPACPVNIPQFPALV